MNKNFKRERFLRRDKFFQKDQMKKGIYILPNLFTTASLFAGIYAIIASIQGQYIHAAIAIPISLILDGLDGRIARMTHTTSRFGVEYDSLSDLVAFGVAPSVLAYTWSLSTFGKWGWLAAALFTTCGALRLARFNVQIGVIDSRYFNGLAIPAAAIVVAGRGGATLGAVGEAWRLADQVPARQAGPSRLHRRPRQPPTGESP